MYIYNQEGKKEHIIVESGRTILAAQLVLKSTHKATLTAENQAGRVWVYGIPKDHKKKNVTLINGDALNIAGDEDPTDPSLTPLEPIMTILTMDYTSKEYIGLIIEIKDSEYVKSISDVHLTFTQMPLVEPGINNLANNYTIWLYNVVIEGEDYKYTNSNTATVTQLIENGSQLTLPDLEPITDESEDPDKDYGIHTGWRNDNRPFISGNIYNKNTDGEDFYPTWTFEFKYDLTGTELLMEQLIDLRDSYPTTGFIVTIGQKSYFSLNPSEGQAFEDIEDVEKTNIASGSNWNDSKVNITATVGLSVIAMESNWDDNVVNPATFITYIVPLNLTKFISDIDNLLSLTASVET